MCLSPPFSPFSPSAAITSPSALKLLLIFCVSLTLSLSAPFAKLTLSLSLPARSTRFKLPSQRSPVPGHPSMPTLTPLMRSVNTECEREERSFMSVAATLRRDWATARRERTCEGEVSRIISTSVTRVEPVLPSCLISCFFLSNSPFPRRSLIVSLYWRLLLRREKNDNYMAYNFEELSLHLVFPTPALHLISDAEDLLDRAWYHS